MCLLLTMVVRGRVKGGWKKMEDAVLSFVLVCESTSEKWWLSEGSSFSVCLRVD